MPSPCPHPAASQQLLFGARDYITGDRFRVEQCANCGLAFTQPRPSPAELGKYYPATYHGGGSKRFPAIVEGLQRALYRRRAVAVERMLGKKGAVLDIGCGPGFLLREFRERGWTVHGTEFSETSAAHARDILKLPVSVGETSALPRAGFDAVVMWHVLEHMPDPERMIAEVARLLPPGGVFLCAVPNFGGVEARVARDKWFHLDVPRHLSHFTVDALTSLLAVHGFTVERTSSFALEYDYFSFTQSMLNRLGLRHNLLYHLLRGVSAKVLGEKPAPAWEKLASLLLAAPLGILSVPATTLAALLRTGATVTFSSRLSRNDSIAMKARHHSD